MYAIEGQLLLNRNVQQQAFPLAWPSVSKHPSITKQQRQISDGCCLTVDTQLAATRLAENVRDMVLIDAYVVAFFCNSPARR
jgi:hypothetical protein